MPEEIHGAADSAEGLVGALRRFPVGAFASSHSRGGPAGNRFERAAEIEAGPGRGIVTHRPSGGVRQAAHRPAPAKRIPQRVAQRGQVVTGDRVGEGVGGGVLEVVGLVEDQMLGVVDPLVIRHDQCMVEHRDMGVREALARPTMKVEPVKRGNGRACRILQTQDAAQIAQRGTANPPGRRLSGRPSPPSGSGPPSRTPSPARRPHQQA